MKNTKEILVMVVLFTVVMIIWSVHLNAKAEASAKALALLIHGQVPIPSWRPVIPECEDAPLLKVGVFTACSQARTVLAASILRQENQPTGFHVTVSDPASDTGRSKVPKEEWLIEARTALAALDAYIALLRSDGS